jgi:hypothetical protein
LKVFVLYGWREGKFFDTCRSDRTSVEQFNARCVASAKKRRKKALLENVIQKTKKKTTPVKGAVSGLG